MFLVGLFCLVRFINLKFKGEIWVRVFWCVDVSFRNLEEEIRVKSRGLEMEWWEIVVFLV